MESLKLTFTMSLEDWLAFQNHYMKTSARYRDVIFAWQWFFAILFGSIVAYVFSDVSPEVGLGAPATAQCLRHPPGRKTQNPSLISQRSGTQMVFLSGASCQMPGTQTKVRPSHCQ